MLDFSTEKPRRAKRQVYVRTGGKVNAQTGLNLINVCRGVVSLTCVQIHQQTAPPGEIILFEMTVYTEAVSGL